MTLNKRKDFEGGLWSRNRFCLTREKKNFERQRSDDHVDVAAACLGVAEPALHYDLQVGGAAVAQH